jgi:hypothetical protein
MDYSTKHGLFEKSEGTKVIAHALRKGRADWMLESIRQEIIIPPFSGLERIFTYAR